jgi:hypothetical protein
MAFACGSAFVEGAGDTSDSGGDGSPGENSDGSSVTVGPPSGVDGGDAGDAHDGRPDSPHEDSEAPEPDGGVGVLDAESPDSTTLDSGTPDAGAVDACASEEPDAATGVFVSASKTATTGCGAINAPCGTISAGISAAMLGGKSIVYVDRGTYDEQVTLANGIAITGGWIYDGSTSWSRECATDPSALAIVAPTTAYSSIVLPTSVTTTVSDLTVQSLGTVPAGQSVYGIFASGTGHLTLDSVEVTMGAAGNGAAGSGVVATPMPACDGPGDGGTGAPASPGTPAAGVYSSAGYSPGNGGSGAPGNDGQPGTAGGMGKSMTGEQCAGGGVTECVPGTTTTSSPGSAGCGGPGGTNGLGGGGGGSSIGLFVWGATVALKGGLLSAGPGGNGASGEAGGAPPGTWSGMNGSAGATGTETTCKLSTAFMMTICVPGTASFPGGTAGGAGGEGSQGGAGANGSGGDSYAYFTGGGGVVTGASSVALSFSTAGNGGTGSIPGYSGHAADHN